jgi:hypothetical protein
MLLCGLSRHGLAVVNWTKEGAFLFGAVLAEQLRGQLSGTPMDDPGAIIVALSELGVDPKDVERWILVGAGSLRIGGINYPVGNSGFNCVPGGMLRMDAFDLQYDTCGLSAALACSAWGTSQSAYDGRPGSVIVIGDDHMARMQRYVFGRGAPQEFFGDWQGDVELSVVGGTKKQNTDLAANWVCPFDVRLAAAIGAAYLPAVQSGPLQWSLYCGPDTTTPPKVMGWLKALAEVVAAAPVVVVHGRAEAGHVRGNRSILGMGDCILRLDDGTETDPYGGYLHSDGCVQTLDKDDGLWFTFLSEYQELTGSSSVRHMRAAQPGHGVFPNPAEAMHWGKIDRVWSEGFLYESVAVASE